MKKGKSIFFNLISILCIIICIIARIMNIGWLFMFMMFFGPIYAIGLFISNFLLIKNFDRSWIAKLIYASSCIFSIIAAVSLPDFGDTPDSVRVFFGLINEQPLYSMITQFSLPSIILGCTSVILGFCINPILNSTEKRKQKKLEKDDIEKEDIEKIDTETEETIKKDIEKEDISIDRFKPNRYIIILFNVISIIVFCFSVYARLNIINIKSGLIVFLLFRGFLFLYPNYKMIKYFHVSEKPKWLFFISCITFIIPQISDNEALYSILAMISITNIVIGILGFSIDSLTENDRKKLIQ